MADKKKVYTIEFNVEKAHENICLLKDALCDLEYIATKSELTTAMSNIFGSIDGAGKIVKSFGSEIEKLALNMQEIEKAIKSVEAVQKELAKNAEKKEEKKAEPETPAREPMPVEIEKKQIESSAMKYGDTVKYTKESLEVYARYFKSLEDLYKEDAERLKKVNEEKEAYYKREKEIAEGIENTKASQESLVVKDKNGKDNTFETTLNEFKHLENLKADADAKELVMTKLNAKEEEKHMTERKARIEELAKIAVVKETKGMFTGYIDVEKTRENYELLKKLRQENIDNAHLEKDKIASIYDELSSKYTEETEGWTALQEEKQKKMHEIDTQIVADTEAMKTERQGYFDNVASNIAKLHAEFEKYYGAIGGLATNFLTEQIEGLKEEQEAAAKVIAEKEKAQKEHQSKIDALKKESTSAEGGRAMVVQEQLAREMAARDELLQQQKEAEKEKAEIDKQMERKKKQQAKIAKVQEMAKATADQAAAVIKAWGMGPVLGPIMAAITIAATAIQIAKMKREWGKLEDGGLLRGKRHSQGGMRIEGTNIEVEGDEYVVNRISTRKNLGLVDYINNSRRELSPADITAYYTRSGKVNTSTYTLKRMYEDGGQLTNLDVAGNAVSTINEDKILDAISKINFRPVVSVVDIANAQDTVSEIKQIVGA